MVRNDNLYDHDLINNLFSIGFVIEIEYYSNEILDQQKSITFYRKIIHEIKMTVSPSLLIKSVNILPFAQNLVNVDTKSSSNMVCLLALDLFNCTKYSFSVKAKSKNGLDKESEVTLAESSTKRIAIPISRAYLLREEIEKPIPGRKHSANKPKDEIQLKEWLVLNSHYWYKQNLLSQVTATWTNVSLADLFNSRKLIESFSPNLVSRKNWYFITRKYCID